MESSPSFTYAGIDSLPSDSLQWSYGNQGLMVALESKYRFLRLESDGHLKVYEWGGAEEPMWKVLHDLLMSEIGECGYPMVCGNYGVCLPSNGQCSCPEPYGTPSNEIAILRPIDYRQPNSGCSLAPPISCGLPQYHYLVELRNTTHFSMDKYYEGTEMESCKMNCLKNCSCKAAIFGYPSYDDYLLSRSLCVFLVEVSSFVNDEDGDIIHVFLKVQNSPLSIANSLQKKSRHVNIILGISFGALSGFLCTGAFCFYLLKRKRENKEHDEFSHEEVPGMPARFSYHDLKEMTNDFNNKLGEGGFGSVFLGTLCDGTQVAVKLLSGLGQVKKSFLAEVKTIGTIHHVNLVTLVGFCAENSHRLLVYEYMSNGSLDKWIFQRQGQLTLGWQSRRKINMDIAKGLAYLHGDCKQKIVHLDIKPQNILLDEFFNAKISDFGLSKLIDKDQSQVVTTLRGTPGYIAPEWLSSIITEKVDVYSFGVMVLEILCGRKNLDRYQAEEDMHLLHVLERKAKDGQLLDMVEKYNEDMQLHREEVTEMMNLAAWCLQSDFSRRPSMSVVVKVMEGSADVESNLDYNFTAFTVRRSVVTGRQEDVIAAYTPMLPSALSGPR
ncbi:Non-specific serine/threonine protein kinase [Bertholletia excelsa]